MTDNLAAVRAQINSLIDIRDRRIATAEALIAHANKDFDRDAVPLMREANKLEAAQSEAAPASSPKRRQKKLPDTDEELRAMGFDDEDIHHYRELQAK